MAQVKVAFKNVLDERATYKPLESNSLATAAMEYARVYCQDSELYKVVMTEKVHLELNGKHIGVDDWAGTLLQDNDEILILPTLEGDIAGGGLLGIILGAILIAVSIFMPASIPLFMGIVLTKTAVFLMGAAMLLGGLMAMFMAPDLPTMNVGGLTGNNSPTYTWSGISTQARPDAPVPIVYGKHIIGGNLINIFTERQGADDYLYMLIALSEGEIEGIVTEDNTDVICTTTDRSADAYKHPWITLDDQPFKNYSDVEWWYRVGTNTPLMASGQFDPTVQNIIPHFTGSRMQMDDGRPLQVDGIIYTTTKEVDMATLQVRFPSMFNANGGSVSSTSVTFGIEFRKNGTDTWYEVTNGRIDPVVTPQLSTLGTMTPARDWGTNMVYTTDVPGLQQGGAYALTDEVPDRIWVQVTNKSESTPDNIIVGEWATTSVVTTTFTLTCKNLTTNEMWDKQVTYTHPVSYIAANNYYDPGWWKRQGPLTQTAQRMTIGAFDVKIPGTIGLGETWIFSSVHSGQYWKTITDKTKTGIWDATTVDFHNQANGSGTEIYDLRVKRKNPISDDFNVANAAVLMSVIEIINGDFIYPNTALLGLRIKATDQLSGSPPNFNVLVKGTKILVPDLSGSENFEECFWDADLARWEYSGAERTWDGSTYIEEYCNNSMLCLKDLMTNKIYGLGEYTNDNDFNDANTNSIVKQCHIEYAPTETDYVSWWDAGNPTEFAKNIEDGMSTLFQKTLTINSGANTITYDSGYSHWIPFRLDAPLKGGQRYRFSITLSGTDANVDIDIAIRRRDQWGNWYQIGDYTAPEISDKGDGTHTYDFTSGYSGSNAMIIQLKKTGAARNCSGTITDISLDSIVGTGSNRAWHYHTYNAVLDSKQAALGCLLEFTNSFRVWPSWYEGTFQFIMDKDETPIHTLSLSNSSGFTQTWTPLSEIPYRIIAQYADEDSRYDVTQIMIQSNDTNVPKSNEQTIGLKGITNRKRASREVKFRLSKFTNSTHAITLKCGMDMIHATAGDIINVSNDLPAWGHGTRVASYNESSKYIYLTEPFTIANATPADIMMKYQDVNNNFLTATLNVTGISDDDVVRRVTLKSWPGNPNINGPAAMGLSTSYVKKFRLLSVSRSGEEEVELNALEHISTLYDAEPVLVVNQDFETNELVARIGKPGMPIEVEIFQLLAIEGMGFDIHAVHPDTKSQEIIVELGEAREVGSGAGTGTGFVTSFHQIGIIASGQTTMRYINSNLKTGEEYTFRLYARGITGSGPSVYQTAMLEKQIYEVAPVTGLQIKGSDPLSQTYDGLDVTIQWNPVGQDWYRSGLMDFYTLKIYHTSYDAANPSVNLLRIAYPKKTEYRYTYDMNIEDNTDGAKRILIFIITANLINGVESPNSRPFRITNAAPDQPSNFTSGAWMRTVTFKWSPDTGTDFKQYRMRHKLTDTNATPVIGEWSAWETRTNNEFTRTVSGTEINTYGEQTKIFFEVKAVDLYNASSAIASGNRNTQTLNIKTVDIATGAVGSTAITASAITTSKLSTFAVEADKIAANAVTAGKISVASLSAISADIGIVTAGLAKSSDGRMQVDFTQKWIKVFDATATLRVHLGYIP